MAYRQGESLSNRRDSAYIVPIPKTKRPAVQAEFECDTEGSANLKTNDLVNRIRDRADQCRALTAGQWPILTNVALENAARPRARPPDPFTQTGSRVPRSG